MLISVITACYNSATAIAFIVLRYRRGIFYFTCSRSERGFFRDLLLVHLAKAAGWTVINHVHGADIDRFLSTGPAVIRRLKASAYRRVDTHIVLGPGIERALRKYPFIGTIECIPNPVDRRLAQAPHKTRPVPPPLRVLYLSHVMYSKGIFDVLAACRQYQSCSDASGAPELQLKVAGEFLGDEHMSAGECRRRFDAARGTGVEYVGIADHATKTALLQEAHVFVLPTFYASEGLPLALLEALASGCACVVTRAGCIGDYLTDRHVWFVEQRKPATIVDALNAIARYDDGVQSRIRAVRQLWQDVFSFDAFARRMNDVISSTVSCP